MDSEQRRNNFRLARPSFLINSPHPSAAVSPTCCLVHHDHQQKALFSCQNKLNRCQKAPAATSGVRFLATGGLPTQA